MHGLHNRVGRLHRACRPAYCSAGFRGWGAIPLALVLAGPLSAQSGSATRSATEPPGFSWPPADHHEALADRVTAEPAPAGSVAAPTSAPADFAPATAAAPVDSAPSALQPAPEAARTPPLWDRRWAPFWPPAPWAEPLVSDRPDFTESASVVPRGRFQLEGGYTFSYDRESGRRRADHTLPELLLRTGLMDGLELRVGWPGFSFTESRFSERNDVGRRVPRTDHDDAGTDMDLGFKLHLAEQQGWMPEFAVIGMTSLPTGAASKSSGDVDPEVKWLWSYALSPRWSLGGNVNLAVPTGEAGRFFQTSASVSVGCALTDWLGTYVEYFGFYPGDRGSDCAHYLSGGFTFPVQEHLQFDIRSGFGLNEEADDFFVGVGFAIRF
jgi:hypothetical protein